MKDDKMINGINFDQLFSTIKLIDDKPEIAQFQFRATNQWVDGTHNRASVKDFYGACQEDTARTTMTMEMDEPPVLCGNNLGANPGEFLLIALSGCLTTSLITHSTVRGLEINDVSSRLEGDIDLRGFMGVSHDVPVEFQAIRAFFTINAEVSMSQKKELLQVAQKFSPVFNSLKKTIMISVELENE